MNLITLSQVEWRSMAPIAHKAVFGVDRSADYERCDWVVLAIDAKDKPLGFATVRELNKNEVYLQFGGIFDKFRNSTTGFRSLQRFLNLIGQNFKLARTFVEAENSTYMRLALKAGFIPCGFKVTSGQGFVELEIALEKPKAFAFQSIAV